MNLTDPATFVATARIMRDLIYADPMSTQQQRDEADACVAQIELQASL